MNEFFKKAGDLDNIDNVEEKSRIISTFKKDEGVNSKSRVRINFPENESKDEDINTKTSLKTKMEDLERDITLYLDSVVSGVKYDMECEMGTLCGEGNVIVSLNKLREMVDDGNYNIVSATYFNPDMIEVKYQEFSKEIKMFR